MRWLTVLPLLLLPAALPAQTARDSTCVARSLVRTLDEELARWDRAVGRPVSIVFLTGPTAWDSAVARGVERERARRFAPGEMPGDTAHALQLGTEGFLVRGDSARVVVLWSSCDLARPERNWYGTPVEYVLARSGSTWRYASRAPRAAVEGRCDSATVKPPSVASPRRD